MESSSEQSLKLPTFDGDHKNFQIWWTRFKAYAAVYKFGQALTIGGKSTMPDKEDTKLDETKPDEKESADARRRNAVAMVHFTMAFTNKATMGLAYKAMSQKEWPGGLAHLVVAALLEKYQPQDTITRVELRQMLSAIKMKKNDNPATIFEQISTVENKYNTATRQIEEEELIAVVLDVAPIEYQTVLTTEQRFQGSTLQLKHLESAMTQHYRQLNGKRNKNGKNSDQDDTEVSLLAFGGTCWDCGKRGHRADKCPEKQTKNTNSRKKNKSKKLNGTCLNCGRVGHQAADCWEKDENKDKRPKNWKSAGERGNAAINFRQRKRC